MKIKADFSVPVILFIIFVVLKLCKVITWSWWWVCSPLWISALVVLAIWIAVFLIMR